MLLLALIFSFSTLDSLLLYGIDLSYHERYSEAEAIFFEARDRYPESPAPYFFLSTLYSAYMTDMGTSSLEDKFFAYIDTTLKKVDSILKKNEDPWAYLWRGSALMGRGFYRYSTGDILGMLEDGIKGFRALERAIALDSGLYDAYLGIGISKYINYRIRRSIPFVGGSDDWKEKFQIAINFARFSNVAAKNVLALLLIEERAWNPAIEIAKELLKEYPDSRTFTWTLAKAYYGKEDWEKAEKVYIRLIHLIEKVDALYPLLYARDKLAEIYIHRGKERESRIEALRILELTEAGDKRFSEFRKRAERRLGRKRGGE